MLSILYEFLLKGISEKFIEKNKFLECVVKCLKHTQREVFFDQNELF